MLQALMLDGRIASVVDSATDLDRMPVPLIRRMCADVGVPWRGLDGDLVRIVAIRPAMVVAWDAPLDEPTRRETA